MKASKKNLALAISIAALLNGSSALSSNTGSALDGSNTGTIGNVTSTTGEGPNSVAPNTGILTSPQNSYTPYAPTAPGFVPGVGVLGNGIYGGGSNQNTVAPKFGGLYTNNGLPPTSMDSFVQNSMLNGTAFYIYGDEGSGNTQDGYGGLPPLSYFLPMNRINSGITGFNGLGLTTGHSSLLPSATGADEFVGPQLGYPIGEWSMSGSASTFMPELNVVPGGGLSIGMPGVPATLNMPGF